MKACTFLNISEGAINYNTQKCAQTQTYVTEEEGEHNLHYELNCIPDVANGDVKCRFHSCKKL